MGFRTIAMPAATRRDGLRSGEVLARTPTVGKAGKTAEELIVACGDEGLPISARQMAVAQPRLDKLRVTCKESVRKMLDKNPGLR